MRPRLPFPRWLLGAAALGLLAAPGPLVPRAAAAAAPSAPGIPVPTALAAAADDGPVDVLVSYDPAAALARVRPTTDGSPTRGSVDAASAVYASLKRQSLAPVGDAAEVVEDFAHLPVQKVRVASREALEDLAADPAVTGLSTSRTFHLDAAPNLELVEQPAAVAAGYTGAGSVVAVLDSGVTLAGTGGAFGNCTGGPGTGTCRIDFHQNADAGTFEDVDPERHGTNVAAIVAAVAPAAHLRIYGVFVETQGGEVITTTDIVLAALDHLARTAPAGAVRAVNLSLGDPLSRTDAECTGSPFAPVFAHLRSIGILPVVAAGNGASSTGLFQSGLSEPACAPGALRVGAVYGQAVSGILPWGSGLAPQCIDVNPAARQVTCFSQTGPLLSLLAPGVGIQAGGVELSGTSQATPHVAGAVAILHQADPAMTADQTAAVLRASGPIISDTRTSPPTQRPLLDIAAAVRRAAPAAVSRLQGADRIATALATSQASYPADAAGAVVLASSESFPDGLAGTPLTAAKDAPLLLTTAAGLRADVLAEIQRVLAPGRTVYVLGGTTALSPAVATAITDAGFPVERIAGPDRYATAVAIADALGSPTQVFLATGLNFPDALAAGVAAAHVGGAVLFTQGTTPAPATTAWLDARPSLPKTIVGGTALGTAGGAAEVVGADRYETATRLATRVWGDATGPVVAVASGTAFPDALSGGAHIARRGGPILLTRPDGLPDVVRAWLAARATTVDRVFLYGGPVAVSDAVVGAVRSATD